jgi:hypothetical protein
MNDSSQTPAALLKRMSRVVTPAASDALEPERRRRIAGRVDALLTELRLRDRRARTRTLWAIFATAAAIALGLGGATLSAPGSAPAPPPAARIRAQSGHVVVVRDGQASSASSAATDILNEADELRTASAATARLALESRAMIEVGQGTTLRVLRLRGDLGEHLHLARGRVDVDVPESRIGPGLRVETPDALVTVHGTRFSVDVRAESGTTLTRVNVLRGRVEVESRGMRALLGPGAEWSSRPRSAERPGPPEGTDARHAPSGADKPAARPGKAQDVPRPATSGADRSTLAEENRLYEQALAEARRGNSAAALDGLAHLMRTYPHSPLLQNATVERFRILRRAGDPGAAAREAARYLSQYPAGFAREEAELVIKAGTPEPGR